MLGRRSLNLELATFDSEIERTAKDNLRTPPNSPANSQSSESNLEKSMKMGERDLPRSLRQLFSPTTTNIPSCTMLPATNVTRFKLKPSVINSLPSFRALENEDPYVHVSSFLDVYDFVNVQNFPIDSVRLLLFPFSLHDKVKFWLLNNKPGSITSWEMMQSKFYHKFFPISRINDLHL